ncbi:unnamed protein product [Arctia plantaginis]|uniref:Protein quiver n=1 Tax=Arctia plantaginis TaxID=874455 RepID=A0A8S0ZM21_ARCPL|nr:unnamed protein product [Arctia plantaginis]
MIILLFSVAALMPHVIAQSCHLQRCIGCQPEQAANVGTPTQCQEGNWVSATWIVSDAQQPSFPAFPPTIPIQYSCLQMVATPDDTTIANTVDRIRGCIPRPLAESVCQNLVAVQRARAHSDARCYICNGDNCNSVSRIAAPLHIAIFLTLLYVIFS